MGIGSIEVNWGSMFSGKTEQLFRSVRRSRIAGKKVKLYKPLIDNRYTEDIIVTHYGEKFKCEVLENIIDILEVDLNGIDVIGIDEGQFFGDDLVKVCSELKYLGKEVIVSGLDMWSTGEPIMNMSLLAAISNNAVKHHAVCTVTGKDAYISHSLVRKSSDVLVGGSESYIAVCEEAHFDLLKEGK